MKGFFSACRYYIFDVSHVISVHWPLVIKATFHRRDYSKDKSICDLSLPRAHVRSGGGDLPQNEFWSAHYFLNETSFNMQCLPQKGFGEFASAVCDTIHIVNTLSLYPSVYTHMTDMTRTLFDKYVHCRWGFDWVVVLDRRIQDWAGGGGADFHIIYEYVTGHIIFFLSNCQIFD